MVRSGFLWILYLAAAVIVASGFFFVLYLGIGGAFPYLVDAFWRYGYWRYVVAAVFGVVLVIVIVSRRKLAP
jgi:hypothetical protein